MVQKRPPGAEPPGPGEGSRRRRLARQRVWQAVRRAARAVGLEDPEQIRRLAEEAVRRLEQGHREHLRLLPGLEGYLPDPLSADSYAPSPAQIEGVVRGLLAQEAHLPAGRKEGTPRARIGSPARPTAHRQQDQVPRKEKETSVAKREAPAPGSPRRTGPPQADPAASTWAIHQLPPNTVTVLERRYLEKDPQGRAIETPEGMMRRVAHNLAQAELLYATQSPEAPRRGEEDALRWEEEFFRVLANLEYLPNSPTLMNAGRDLQQLSACFVLPVADSIEGIFDAIKWTAMIHKSGGGTGFAFSRLRPRNDFVQSTSGIASGPVSFMKIFNAATEEVKQGGTRRGANMGILRVDHPDILDFIICKADNVSITNFNISVAATEEFMRAREENRHYDLVNPRTKEVTGRLGARGVFQKIVENAWRNGDPGLVFLDRMNASKANPVPKRGPIESTNPCGEQPLYPFDSCNLGSINLARMLMPTSPEATLGDYAIDWEKLGRTVEIAVRLLDNVIDMNRYPIPQIEEVTKAVRRIGLGVMGFADMLILLGIPYNSERALSVGEQVMAFISQRADLASEKLAEERGVFPDWEDSIYGPKLSPNPRRMRNATRTTIAPTGTISIIAGCSSGIEPLFAICFVRNVLDGDHLIEVNPIFEAIAKQEGFYSKELMARIAARASIQEMTDIPEHVRRAFITAHDVAPEWHVRLQAAFQRHTDNAVSKTINFPYEATVEDVEKAYLLAYQEGCKGITIYRDGSREMQVLSTGETPGKQARLGGQAAKEEMPVEAALPVRARPTLMRGVTERIRTGHGTMYITINEDEGGRPFEVFSTLGKAGGCDSAHLEAISRLVSLALRSGISPADVIDQLRGITCCPVWDQGVQVKSAPDAVALALVRHLARRGLAPAPEAMEEAAPYALQAPLFQGNGDGPRRSPPCPDCSNPLILAEGCLICRECGYTKCG